MANVLERLERFNMTRRQMAAILMLLAFIPIIIPIGLPIYIGGLAKDYYNEVERLKPGDVLVFSSMQVGYLAERDVVRATIYHATKKGAKILIYCFWGADPQEWVWILEYIDMMKLGYKYGEDYILFPFLAGDETAFAAVAKDLGVTRKDFYGTPVEDLPLMSKLKNGPHSDLTAVALAWTRIGQVVYVEGWIRQWLSKYGVRGIDCRGYTNIAPWYGTYIFGCLDGLRGYAEYEKLTGYIGVDVMKMDVNNLTGTFTIVATFVGIIGWVSAHKKKIRVR